MRRRQGLPEFRVRYLQESGYKKGLLIVPTTSLVEQMFTDFQANKIEGEKMIVDICINSGIWLMKNSCF